MRLYEIVDFNLVDEKYTHNPVQASSTSAVVQIWTADEATVTVQRALDGLNFTDVGSFETTIDGLGEFNIINIIPWQFIRIVSTADVSKMNILI